MIWICWIWCNFPVVQMIKGVSVVLCNLCNLVMPQQQQQQHQHTNCCWSLPPSSSCLLCAVHCTSPPPHHRQECPRHHSHHRHYTTCQCLFPVTGGEPGPCFTPQTTGGAWARHFSPTRSVLLWSHQPRDTYGTSRHRILIFVIVSRCDYVY